jgi:GTP cyclohydrolase II
MGKKLKSTTLEKTKDGELQMVAQAKLPTRYGDFTIYGFKGAGALDEAVALVRGNLNGKVAPLVRVHSQCLTGDAWIPCRLTRSWGLRRILATMILARRF